MTLATSNMKHPVALVPGGGAIGGLLSIALPPLGVIPGIEKPGWWMFPVGAFVGAVAAFVGVFLLFNTDRSDKPRLVAWAMVLGLLWQPVIVAATALVRVEIQKREVARKLDRVAEEVTALESAPATTQAALSMQDVGTELAVLTAQVNSIPNEAVRATFTERLTEVVSKYASVARSEPEFAPVAASALMNIQQRADREEQAALVNAVGHELPKMRDMAWTAAVHTTTRPVEP